MKTLLTIDIGTTSVKICIFKQDFKMLCQSMEEYKLKTKGNDIVELEAEAYWKAVKNGIRSLLSDKKVSANDISAIAITTQGETLIPVDENGKALNNAIVWLDGRAVEEAKYINSKFSAKKIFSITGIPECNGLCPVSKLLWFKNNLKDIYEKTYKFLMLEDYIILKLTGKFVTEKSLASTSGYFDIVNDCVWKEILQYIEVDECKLPDFLECGEIVSKVLPSIASELGISENTVVVTAAMDQTCGAVGAGNIQPGIITETTGTALCIGATSNTFEVNDINLVPIYRHIEKNKYLAIPVSMTAGIVLKWFKDVFCKEEALSANQRKISVYSILDEMAERSPVLANGLLLLPHFNGMLQPYNKPKAKGSFWGVGLETTKDDFVRAIFEGVAYMLRENVELVESLLNIKVNEIRSLGGGAKSNIWCGIKADITGKDIILMNESECTSLGAAILSSVALGLHENVSKAVSVANTVKSKITSNEDIHKQYVQGYSVYSEIFQCIKELY